MIDRLCKGNVINFININNIVHFNIAYIYIVISWLGIVVLMTKNTMKKIKKGRK